MNRPVTRSWWTKPAGPLAVAAARVSLAAAMSCAITLAAAVVIFAFAGIGPADLRGTDYVVVFVQWLVAFAVSYRAVRDLPGLGR